MRLRVLSQVGLLPEGLAALAAEEGLLARVRPHVNVHRVPVLEALPADLTVVEVLRTRRRRGR